MVFFYTCTIFSKKIFWLCFNFLIIIWESISRYDCCLSSWGSCSLAREWVETGRPGMDRPQFSCTATGDFHSACNEQTQHSTIEKLRRFVFYAWLVCSSKLVRCRAWPVPLWTRTFWPILKRKASSSNPKSYSWHGRAVLKFCLWPTNQSQTWRKRMTNGNGRILMRRKILPPGPPCANKPKSEIRPALRHEFQLQLQLQIWLSGCPWRNLRFHINSEYSQHSPSLFSLPFKAPCKAHLGFSLLHLHLFYTSYNMSHAGLRGHLAQGNIVQWSCVLMINWVRMSVSIFNE